MTLADAHLHLFRRGFPGVYGRSLLASEIDVYEAFREKHSIAAGLIIGYEDDGIDPTNNSYLRELAATRPWMATLAYVAARAMPSPTVVEGLLAAGHAGLAVYVLDDTAAEALSRWDAATWRALGEQKAIISFNIRPPRVGLLAAITEAAPQCRLLVSHIGLPGSRKDTPGREAARAEIAPLLALAQHPNVLVKLSGFYAVSDPSHAWPHPAAAPFVELLVEDFGADRCLWASDFSPALDHVSFVQTITVPGLDAFDEETRSAVMGGNLLRLLGRKT